MSSKKSRKDESSSSSEEEEEKPKLLSLPTLKPPKGRPDVKKTTAVPPPPPREEPPAPASAVTPPPPPQSSNSSSGGELYTWKKALELAKPQLEELYGKPSALNPLPFQVRNIFGDTLCPTKDGQDFYLPVEQLNMDNVKAYYESLVSKISDEDLNIKVVKSWYMNNTKRGLVKCFQETTPLMQEEMKLVIGLLNKESERKAVENIEMHYSSETLGTKRKGASEEEEPPSSEDAKRQREEPKAHAYASVSDFIRSRYSSATSVASAKANHHDNSDGYDISALVAASAAAADVGASRKIEVASYRSRALPF